VIARWAVKDLARRGGAWNSQARTVFALGKELLHRPRSHICRLERRLASVASVISTLARGLETARVSSSLSNPSCEPKPAISINASVGNREGPQHYALRLAQGAWISEGDFNQR